MSGYSDGGASTRKKTLKTWYPQHYSAKRDIDRNLRMLRNRAHDLAINSPLGSAIISTLVTGVIGAGLKVFPRADAQTLGISSKEAQEWSRKVKLEFELWSNQCDYLRRNTFEEMQVTVFASSLTDGDCFCLFRREKGRPYTLRLQAVEAGRISNPNGTEAITRLPSGNIVVNGIESDTAGRQEAIWISNRQWDEADELGLGLSWERVKIYGEETGLRNVLHICKDMRPDQNRGVPILAPVIESLKQISRYAEAELTSAIIRSFFSVFFTQALSNLDLNEITGVDEKTGAGDDDFLSEFKLGAGTVTSLPRGVDVKAIDSSKQNAYDAFVTNFEKQTAAALGLPYEVVMKNFQSSYSASRAALLQADSEYKRRKAAFITDFCQPIYEQFLLEAVSLGRIEAAGFEDPIKRAAWSKAGWYNESSRILDPQRETQAMILRLQHGLTTYEKELAENSGLDFNEVQERLKQEREMVKDG